MIQHLSRHGCRDLTQDLSELDGPESSGYPLTSYTGGSFGDVWMVRMKDGRRIAVKCLKQSAGNDEDVRRLTVRTTCLTY